MRQTIEAAIAPPKRFFWQGNHWQVCAVQRFWIEALPWWRTVNGERVVDRRVWRVEAASPTQQAIFDLVNCGLEWTIRKVWD